MTGYIITGLIILAMGLTIYLLFKRIDEVKADRDTEKSRADQYHNAMQTTKELQEKAVEIDKQIEVEKNERKKLSKADKIKLANSRNSGD